MSDDVSPPVVDRLEPARTVDLAETLLGFETGNPPGETRAAVDWIEAWLEDRGLRTERFAVDPAKPNLVATLPGAGEGTLCLNGHLDTVPYDADAWERDPLGERVADEAADSGTSGGSGPPDAERLYGRGATDMKGAVASMLAAVEAHVAAERPPPLDLRLVLVSDEETGGDAGLAALLDDESAGGSLREAEAYVVGEPTGSPARPSLAVADRGSIWLTLEATGEAAHGSRPMLGENAIDRLYEGVRTLRERFGSRRLEVDAAVEPILAESVEYHAAAFGEAAAEALFRYPTINLGTIEGGEAINSVPASARARIDVRLSPGIDTASVLSEIRACARECEGVAIAEVTWSVGSATSLEEPVVGAVESVATALTGERVYRRSATGGGDAKKLRRAGVPTVEFALSTPTAHAVDEYTTTAILLDNARAYAALPGALADRLG